MISLMMSDRGSIAHIGYDGAATAVVMMARWILSRFNVWGRIVAVVPRVETRFDRQLHVDLKVVGLRPGKDTSSEPDIC
jgi:hypothetical protein